MKERTYQSIMEEIRSSSKSPQDWYTDLTEMEKQAVLTVLANSDNDISDWVENSEEGCTTNSHSHMFGSFSLNLLNGMTDNTTQDLEINNADGGTTTFAITRKGLKFYHNDNNDEIEIKIQTGQDSNNQDTYYEITDSTSPLEITSEDLATIQTEYTFEQMLALEYKKYTELTPALTIEQAIKAKDFARLKQIIVSGEEISDRHFMQMLRLSTIKQGESEPTTFLHELLDRQTGVGNENNTRILLRRLKTPLIQFEVQQLLNLTYKNTKAKDLFVDKLQALLPENTVTAQTTSEIDTHTESIHASVDISATRLCQRYIERHHETGASCTITEKGEVKLSTTTEFNNKIDADIKSLKNQIKQWTQKTDAELEQLMREGKTGKTVSDLRFELSAAQRLVEACETNQILPSYSVDFNEKSSNGLTLKQILGIVYDSLSDKDNLTTDAPHDNIARFTTLVSYLYQTKREYNDNSTPSGRSEPDRNKCFPGCVNHILYSLHSIHKMVDIAYVSKDLIKTEAANKFISYLKQHLDQSPPPNNKSQIIETITKITLQQAKMTDLLTLVPNLKEKAINEIEAAHQNHFKDDSYLDSAKKGIDALTSFPGIVSAEVVNYETTYKSAKKVIDAMHDGTIPLYSLGQNGYELTLNRILRSEPAFGKKILKEMNSIRNLWLFRKYRIDNEFIPEKLSTTSINYDYVHYLDFLLPKDSLIISTLLNIVTKTQQQQITPAIIKHYENVEASLVTMAAIANNTEMIGDLLAKESNPFLPTKMIWKGKFARYTNALYAAVIFKNFDATKYLVQVDGLLNASSDALKIAILQKDFTIAKCLIDAGAQITDEHFTEAIKNNGDDIVKLLVERSSGHLPLLTVDLALQFAIRTNNAILFKLTLNKSMNIPTNLDTERNTVLMEAAKNSSTEISSLFLEHFKAYDLKLILDQLNIENESALTIALSKGNYIHALFLLQKGADIHRGFYDHQNASSLIIKSENAELLEFLINNNLESLSTVDKQDILTSAVKINNLDLVNLCLIKFPEEINAHKDGDCALKLAVCNKNPQIVQSLLDKNADVNYLDHQGKSPLYWALHNTENNIADLLIAKHAALTDADLKQIVQDNKIDAINYMLSKKTKIYAPKIFAYAAVSGNKAIVELCLEHEGIHSSNKPLQEALISASEAGHTDLAQFLLEKIQLNDDGKTLTSALEKALQKQRTEITKILLNKGATLSEEFKESPLETATSLDTWNAEIALALINKGETDSVLFRVIESYIKDHNLAGQKNDALALNFTKMLIEVLNVAEPSARKEFLEYVSEFYNASEDNKKAEYSSNMLMKLAEILHEQNAYETFQGHLQDQKLRSTVLLFITEQLNRVYKKDDGNIAIANKILNLTKDKSVFTKLAQSYELYNKGKWIMSSKLAFSAIRESEYLTTQFKQIVFSSCRKYFIKKLAPKFIRKNKMESLLRGLAKNDNPLSTALQDKADQTLDPILAWSLRERICDDLDIKDMLTGRTIEQFSFRHAQITSLANTVISHCNFSGARCDSIDLSNAIFDPYSLCSIAPGLTNKTVNTNNTTLSSLNFTQAQLDALSRSNLNLLHSICVNSIAKRLNLEANEVKNFITEDMVKSVESLNILEIECQRLEKPSSLNDKDHKQLKIIMLALSAQLKLSPKGKGIRHIPPLNTPAARLEIR